MYSKRELFTRPDVASATSGDVLSIAPDPRSIARYVRHLTAGSALCITNPLLYEETARHYKKHAPPLDITGENARTPLRKLELALQHSDDVESSGYGWRGFAPDTRLRVVPLVKLLEGAKLFAYELGKAPVPSPERIEEERLDVRVYDCAEGAAYDGAVVVVGVSRRTTKETNHRIVLSGVPLRDGASWRNINASTSCCIDNKFSNVRFSGLDDPKRKIFCGHEIASYWKAAATMHHRGNDVPARLSPFIAPSQELVDFYKRLSSDVVVRDGKRKRMINEAEMEQVLQAYVRSVPFDVSFSNKGKLAERDWRRF